MSEQETEPRQNHDGPAEVVAKTFGELLVSSGSIVIDGVRHLARGVGGALGWTAKSVEEITAEDSVVRQPLTGAYLLGFSALVFAMVGGAALSPSRAILLQMLAAGGLRILWAIGVVLLGDRLLHPLPAQHHPLRRTLALSMTIFALALNGPLSVIAVFFWAAIIVQRLAGIGFPLPTRLKFIAVSVAALAATVVIQWIGQYLLIMAMLALG